MACLLSAGPATNPRPWGSGTEPALSAHWTSPRRPVDQRTARAQPVHIGRASPASSGGRPALHGVTGLGPQRESLATPVPPSGTEPRPLTFGALLYPHELAASGERRPNCSPPTPTFRGLPLAGVPLSSMSARGGSPAARRLYELIYGVFTNYNLLALQECFLYDHPPPRGRASLDG